MSQAIRIRTAIAVLAFGACSRGPAAAPEEPKGVPRDTVELTEQAVANAQVAWQRVVPGSFRPRLRLVGAIAGDPSHLAQVGARAAGRVSAIRVALGDSVRKDQVLLEIDTAELHEVTLKYVTALAHAKAAEDALARQRLLVEERVGAAQDLRRDESEAAASQAAVAEGAEHLRFLGLTDGQIARLERQGANDAIKGQVRSPIDGQIATLDVTVGQVLVGTESVATVADRRDVWASVRVDERDLSSVALGASAEVRVPTYEAKPFPGVVRFVSDVLDPKSRSADVRVALSNSGGLLRPGMSAVAWIERATSEPLWLPVEAVQPHEGRTIVFVHEAGRRFRARDVQAGSEQGGLRAIASGIGHDDEVVVHGAFALRAELERAALEE